MSSISELHPLVDYTLSYHFIRLSPMMYVYIKFGCALVNVNNLLCFLVDLRMSMTMKDQSILCMPCSNQ